MTAILASVVGAILGPLLGVVVDRSVERLPPAAEHRCCHCQTGLGPTSLVPIVSWFGRCPNCERHKGVRYPLVDMTLIVVFGLLGLRFGSDPTVIVYLALATVLVALSAIDVETHLLPNVIVWPSIWASVFTIFVVSGLADQGDLIYSALLGGAVFGGFIGAAHLIHEQGMGRGDVKLALLLGLFLGWLQPDLVLATRLVFYAILAALIGGSIGGLVYNAIRRRGRAEIPFGPALAAAAVVVIVASPELIAP